MRMIYGNIVIGYLTTLSVILNFYSANKLISNGLSIPEFRNISFAPEYENFRNTILLQSEFSNYHKKLMNDLTLEEDFVGDYSTMKTTVASLASHMKAVKNLRKQFELDGCNNVGSANDQDGASVLGNSTKEALECSLLQVSAANLRLLNNLHLGKPLDSHQLLLSPRPSHTTERSSVESDHNIQRRSGYGRGDYYDLSPRQYGGGGYDDCNHGSLGIFNFLTFIIYAFSLLLTLLVLASDDLAGTFFGNLLNILAVNNNLSINNNNNNNNNNTNNNMNSNMNVNMNSRSLRTLWETLVQLFQTQSNREKRHSQKHNNRNSTGINSNTTMSNYFKKINKSYPNKEEYSNIKDWVKNNKTESSSSGEEYSLQKDWAQHQISVGAIRALLQLSQSTQLDLNMCQTPTDLSSLVTKLMLQEASSRMDYYVYE